MTAKNSTAKTSVPQQPKNTVAPRKAVAKKTVAVAATPAAAVPQKKDKKLKKSAARIKVVRDSFNMPQSDYAKIGELKQLCLKNGLQVKKSQLLRAGLHALEKLSAAQLKIALADFAEISTKAKSK